MPPSNTVRKRCGSGKPQWSAAGNAPRRRGLSVPHVSNLEQIQELYGAFGRGEIEPVLAALAPDVEWVEGDIEGLPYRGVHRGPEAVGRDVFAQIPGAYDSFELVPQKWVDGGDTIVMLGRVTIRLDGRESSQNVAQVWTFQDGKITRFESFQDTLATARVLGAVD
jgi:ketosteroid isomerase-like protein